MYKGKRALGAVFWSICLLILILDSKTAIAGASDGIDLCIRILIPSIFPFLVICPMVSANIGVFSSIFRPLGRILRLPDGAEDLFFLGLMSGYPVGAANVSNAARNGRISDSDAQRMLAFCSNAGPAFIFGMGARMFPHVGYCALLWLIHIVSAVTVGILTPGCRNTAKKHENPQISLQTALRNAMSTMATICGWVVLFRILIAFSERWILWFLPAGGRVILRGILELSNGTVSLAGIGNAGYRMLLFSGLLSFGGVCVWMQTVTVCRGLSMRYYLLGKLTQSALSVLLATACQFLLSADQRYWPNPIPLVICIMICISYPILLRKIENRCRNSDLVGV